MAGTLTFRFQAPTAHTVALCGDFNDWDVTALPMARDVTGTWTATLALPAGRHEYKFFVDGRDWWNDPDAPKIANVWGSENSYIDVS